MKRLGLAIESTNKIAVKFDETLKSLTTTMAQIYRHECDIVRNEFEINLSQYLKIVTFSAFLNFFTFYSFLRVCFLDSSW